MNNISTAFNLQHFIDELIRCKNLFDVGEDYTYNGPLFQTNDILACAVQIDKKLSPDFVKWQATDKDCTPDEQFFMAAFQMGFDVAKRESQLEALVRKLKELAESH